jgi:hypothetical protein
MMISIIRDKVAVRNSVIDSRQITNVTCHAMQNIHSYSRRNRSPEQARHLISLKQQLLLPQQQQQKPERDMWARAGADIRMSTKETTIDRNIKGMHTILRMG